MIVNIVKEWFLPENGTKFHRTTPLNPMFYVVLLQLGRIRFLKIGTAENGVGVRFCAQDYKKYNFMKILYVAELEATPQRQEKCMLPRRRFNPLRLAGDERLDLCKK